MVKGMEAGKSVNLRISQWFHSSFLEHFRDPTYPPAFLIDQRLEVLYCPGTVRLRVRLNFVF